MVLKKYIALSNPMHQKKQKKFARQLKEKDDERRVMEEMQEKILTMKGYTRDYEEN